MGPEIRISRPHAPSWPEAFGIAPADLRDWMAHLRPDETVLTWAIRNGMISVQDFLEWAQAHHQLPILSTQYTDQLPEKNQWDKWKDIAQWTPNAFPIAEWDDIIYIGLIDPETPLEIDRTVVKILAHPGDLDTIWNYFTGGRATKGPVVMPDLPPMKSEDGPEGLAWKLPSETQTSDFGHLHSPGTGTELPEGLTNPGIVSLGGRKPEVPPVKISDMPNGLGEGTLSGVNNPVTISRPMSAEKLASPKAELPPLPPKSKAKAPPTPPSKPPPAAKPPLFQRNLNKPAELSPAEEITKSFSKPKLEIPIDETVPEDSVTSFPLNGEPSEPPPPAGTPLEELSARSRSYRELAEARTLTNISKLSFADRTNAEGLPGIVDPSSVDMATFESCTSYEQLGSAAILNMQKYFDHSMLLMFKNNELRPWRWSELWMPTFEKMAPLIELEMPSIFRIVYRTNLPYHGHVVTNDINQKFFTDWNRSAIPKHATIVPLFIDKKIFGMALGLNNDRVPAANQMANLLRTMERVGEELSTHFKRLRAKTHAA